MKITFFVIIFSVHGAFPLLFSDSMESLLNGNPWKSVQTRSEAEPSINEILAFLQVFKVVAQVIIIRKPHCIRYSALRENFRV